MPVHDSLPTFPLPVRRGGGKGNGTGVTFTENQWVHLTWVFDWNENTTNIYVDGVLGESKSLHADFQSKSLENNFDVLVGADIRTATVRHLFPLFL